VLLEIWPNRGRVEAVVRAEPEALARFENEGGAVAPASIAADPQIAAIARL